MEPVWRAPRVYVIAVCGFLILFGFTTFLRAEEWSHPLRLALSEARKRPASMRAQYELARTLVVAAGTNGDSPLVGEAQSILSANALKPESGIAPLQALIFLSGRSHRPVAAEWWTALIGKLRDRPPSQSDIDALVFLFHCQLDDRCPRQTGELLEAFMAALTSSNGDVRLMSAYGDFAFLQLGDAALAENMFRGVIEKQPKVPVYRANLVRFLLASGQLGAAGAELESLKALNRYGSLDAMIGGLQAQLDDARAARPDRPASGKPLPVGNASP